MNKKNKQRLLELCEQLEELVMEMGEIANEVRDKIENMPENLQASQRVEDWQSAVDTLDNAIANFDMGIGDLHEMELE